VNASKMIFFSKRAFQNEVKSDDTLPSGYFYFLISSKLEKCWP
jgi:hypothetical protein